MCNEFAVDLFVTRFKLARESAPASASAGLYLTQLIYGANSAFSLVYPSKEVVLNLVSLFKLNYWYMLNNGLVDISNIQSLTN